MVKNILLTGSGGFVGKNLKEYLQSDYKLLCPRSSELDLTNTNAVKEYFSAHKIDYIIHCASTGGARECSDPISCEADNLKMVQNLLIAKNPEVQMIVFGSGAAYAKDRDLHKVKEQQLGEVIPKDQYGKSKLKIAELALSREDMLCLIIFACYGNGEKQSRFPTYAIEQNQKHESIVINKNVVFDYLYITDLCRIVKAFIEKKPKHRVINVTPSKSVSLEKIALKVNHINDARGFQSKIIFKEQGLNFEYTGDNAVLIQELPDFEFSTIENGLKELYCILEM